MDDHKFLGNYKAKVLATDAEEELKLGRIKVEVYPMLIGKVTAIRLNKTDKIDVEGIEIADLPWCKPACPLSIGSGDGIGSFAVPDVGTFVYVFFEAGDIYQPVYFAEAPTATLGLPAARLTNYPERRVIKFKKIEIIVDDEAGTVKITTDNDVNIIAGDDVNITASGHVSVNATGNVNIDAGGTVDIDGGSIELN
jgi:hypothetical protein